MSAGEPVLAVAGVSKHFGGVHAVQDVSFAIRPREICGLIGPNGAGKTTLFNLVSGIHRPDRGTIHIAGTRADGLAPHDVARLGVSRTFQNLQLFDTLTVRENVMVGLAEAARPTLITSLLMLSRRRRQETADRAAAEGHLERVGLAGAGGRMARDLSFGEQRLVELARALATRPRLLLLDEPASGLTAAEVGRLVALLRGLRDDGLAIFLIEHNVSTVMDVADNVVVLNYGRKIAEGPASAIRHDEAVIEAYLGTTLGRGLVPSAEPVPDTAALLRADRLLTFRGAQQVLHGVSLEVRKGEVAGVVGPNGAGKSTLLGTLAGLYPAASGEIRMDGARIEKLPAEAVVRRGISLVPERRLVFAGLTVRENLWLGAYARADRSPAAVRADIEDVFRLFPRLREHAAARAGSLSGGEQQMLAIGRGLMARPELLMLDEPSLGLAPLIVGEIFQVLRRLEAAGTSLLVVEQNARVVFEIAHRIAILERGRIAGAGAPAALVADDRVLEAYLGGMRSPGGN